MPAIHDEGASERLRVQFIHGLESGPHGHKARYLAQCFDTVTPAMDTSDFEGCVAVQACQLELRRPDVLIGSSFGGAVALALLRRGLYSGPTLLLAQAAGKLGLPLIVPPGIPVLIVHGLRDQVVDIEDSRTLARSGEPPLVRSLEIDDDHRLGSLIATGRLADLVRDVFGSRP